MRLCEPAEADGGAVGLSLVRTASPAKEISGQHLFECNADRATSPSYADNLRVSRSFLAMLIHPRMWLLPCMNAAVASGRWCDCCTGISCLASRIVPSTATIDIYRVR